ncbi:MAG: ATP-dependent DNA helicase [Nocardioides sp.]
MLPTAPGVDAATVHSVLSTAVAALGGQDRPGQLVMADAVASALSGGEHLLVQAGTGTGKSLAYLVPALLHRDRVVVATATLALQHQLVERDLPTLMESIAEILPEPRSYAVLKGRSNYACLHRIREGVPDDQGILVDVPDGGASSGTGRAVVRLRTWAEAQIVSGGTGERDRAPAHTEREWRQVSVNHRECLGAARCAYALECFAESARDRAMRAHLVITNHSLLAIDAIQGVPMIPEYDAVVVDEAHELATRITQAATDELSVAEVERAARRSQRWVEGGEAEALADVADQLASAINGIAPGRIDLIADELASALAATRDAARACLSAYPKESGGEADAGRTQARGAVQEVFTIAERMAAGASSDVMWLVEARERFPARLCVAPLDVAGPVRERLLADKVVIFTSATLMLGGEFAAVAASLGLDPANRTGIEIGVEESALPGAPVADSVADSVTGPQPDGGGSAGSSAWRGIDVGSPFDYETQGILYVAKHLPPPGRHGVDPAAIDEIVGLVRAAGGRTLGLFSSRRAAEEAAEAVRERLADIEILAQGDAQLPELAKRFVGEPRTCLFGTLSLWQGLDVPGPTCQLVVIDRLPFPRPDDPLMSARQRAVERSGGNGFMRIAAAHAALLLAQGSGRLIRTIHDKGVVAVLDPRLATARYGTFLRASLPPMWRTDDPAVVRQALSRLAASVDVLEAEHDDESE